MNSKNKTKAFVFLGVAFVLLITLIDCKQTSGGGGGGTQEAPFVEGGASLILSPDKLTIAVKAKTEDGSDVQVEGCNETTLKSNVETTLNATGTRVALKGEIIELVCSYNQLIELNVQGCASLQKLRCWGNQLTALDMHGLTALQALSCAGNQLTALNLQGLTNLKGLNCVVNKLDAKAMTEILNALPTRGANDNAGVILYTEEKNYTEGNCKDYTQPAELKAAFEGAKSRNWKLLKNKAIVGPVDI